MKRIAAADAAYMAKFGGGTGVVVAATTPETSSPPSTKRSKKEKKEKKMAKAAKKQAKQAAKAKEFRWKKVIRQSIEDRGTSTLTVKALKKKVLKIAKKENPDMSKDDLKKKFDSKWSKMTDEDKKHVEQ